MAEVDVESSAPDRQPSENSPISIVNIPHLSPLASISINNIDIYSLEIIGMSLTDKIALASRKNILSDILDILDIRAGRQLQGQVLGAVEGSLDEGDVVVVSVHAPVRGPRQHELPGGGGPARGARQEEGVRTLPVIREPLQRG